MKTICFIDGENFLHKVKEVARSSKKKGVDVAEIDIDLLIRSAFKGTKIDEIIFYSSKLHEHEEFLEKSKELILFQRRLKASLEKQGVKFVIAGNVRAQEGHGNKVVFHEKGVDVRIAVDMVAFAADHKIRTVILCSSDSDLQPAIKEVRNRKVEVIYLGFEVNPNKGISFTANKTVLFRDPEILEALS